MSGQAIVTIRDRQWVCSVASTPAELATGLSGVPSIPAGTGMLFILGYEQVVTVTAEGMLFPLSVIFIGENLRVTEVAHMLAPGDWGTTSMPCRYFLEVNAGEAAGIEAGDAVNIAFSSPTTNWLTSVVTFAGVAIVGAFMVKMGKTMADAVFGKPKERPVLYGPRGERLLPQVSPGRQTGIYEIEMDGMGNIIITRTDDPGKDVFLQFESDKALVYDLLKKGERKDLDEGWSIQIKRSEPRSSILDELWESSAQPQSLPQITKQKYLAILDKGDTVFQEGDTVSLGAYEKENERVRKLGLRTAYGKHIGDILPPQRIVQTTKKPTRHDVTVEAWQERDRLGIWITDKRAGKTVAEWWDEDAREMFEQGFFKPGVPQRAAEKPGRAFVESVLDYAESVGLLAGSGKYLAQTVRDAYYWTAVNKDTGEIVESHAPYTSSGRALRGGKAFVSRHWRGEALVEVWRQPHRYSEGLKMQPVASEILSLIRQKAPAIIPEQPRQPRLKDELEFLPDSPEFLAYTIEDIGYREKIDSAFLQAIARAKGR